MPPGCRSNCRLSESLLKPTTMLYRNLLAMDAEELLCGHPQGNESRLTPQLSQNL
jgi:hypothetical protein